MTVSELIEILSALEPGMDVWTVCAEEGHQPPNPEVLDAYDTNYGTLDYWEVEIEDKRYPRRESDVRNRRKVVQL
jgi:hypothetical protein